LAKAIVSILSVFTLASAMAAFVWEIFSQRPDYNWISKCPAVNGVSEKLLPKSAGSGNTSNAQGWSDLRTCQLILRLSSINVTWSVDLQVIWL
jgi:hypothetical protein